jgi:hypothetical protein
MPLIAHLILSMGMMRDCRPGLAGSGNTPAATIRQLSARMK